MSRAALENITVDIWSDELGFYWGDRDAEAGPFHTRAAAKWDYGATHYINSKHVEVTWMERCPMPIRAQTPTDQQFETAIMWLQSNEGEGEEAEACNAVASWIEQHRTNAMLREVARKAGVSVTKLRKRLAGKSPPDPEMEN
jgi:hypothetical protein